MGDYKVSIPPFQHGEFRSMKPKEANEYYEWYISEIENRISILFNRIKDDGINIEPDYTKDSLIPLWEWYEKNIFFREKNDEEKMIQKNNYPEWMHPYLSEKLLSYETLAYCMDVAVYFAKVMIENNDSKVKWGYFTKPKNRSSVNQPVLIGFKYDKILNPREIVYNCTLRSGEKRLSSRLYDIYNVWVNFL